MDNQRPAWMIEINHGIFLILRKRLLTVQSLPSKDFPFIRCRENKFTTYDRSRIKVVIVVLVVAANGLSLLRFERILLCLPLADNNHDTIILLRWPPKLHRYSISSQLTKFSLWKVYCLQKLVLFIPSVLLRAICQNISLCMWRLRFISLPVATLRTSLFNMYKL